MSVSDGDETVAEGRVERMWSTGNASWNAPGAVVVTARFVEVADGVHVLREPLLRVNVTLVVGDGAALLVDTLSTAGQATELAAAVRAVTAAPLTVVNTHHHFDHCFGNAPWPPTRPPGVRARGRPPRRCASRTGCAGRRTRRCATRIPVLAGEVAETALLAPTHTVHDETVLDLGGRRVVLRHPGRGHTAGDLVVHVPDADVLVAGDLVEQSGPPAFEDVVPVAVAGRGGRAAAADHRRAPWSCRATASRWTSRSSAPSTPSWSSWPG